MDTSQTLKHETRPILGPDSHLFESGILAVSLLISICLRRGVRRSPPPPFTSASFGEQTGPRGRQAKSLDSRLLKTEPSARTLSLSTVIS
jgi:hypothetical protein